MLVYKQKKGIIMEFLDGVFTKVSKASSKVSESAKTKLEENKLKKEYKIQEEEMNQALRLLGCEVYDRLEKGEVLPDFKEEREKIKNLYDNLINLNSQINILTNATRKCTSCGAVYDANSNFCPVCGHKRELDG